MVCLLENLNSLIKGTIRRRRLALHTLQHQSLWFLRASFHADSLINLRISSQDMSTFSGHKTCERPSDFLHSRLRLTKTTWLAGLTAGRHATCPYTRNCRWCTMQVIGPESVSRIYYMYSFLTVSDRQYPVILRRRVVLRYRFSSQSVCFVSWIACHTSICP